MSATANLGLVYLSQSQQQKEVSINSGWDVLDAAVTRKSGDTMTGQLKIARAAVSTGNPNPDLWIVAPADTGMTASTEACDFTLDFSATRQFATGAISTQRAARIAAPTYSSVGASTITTAATLAISGAPTAGTNVTITNSYALWLQAGNLQIGSQAVNALVGISRAAVSSGTPIPLLSLVGPADTNLAASVEATDILHDLSATRQFATGALTTQRAMRILAPTYGFVGASTITTASTVSISGAPNAGANATITNGYALNVEAGPSFFGGTINVSPSAASRCMTLNHFSGFGGATLYLNPAAGNKRVLLNLGSCFQWGTDVNINNTGDYWLESLTSGNLVTQIDTSDNIKLGGQGTNTPSLTLGMRTDGKLAFFNATPVVRPSAYTLTNTTTSRSLNETGATLVQVANVLGTLIADLQAYGLLQ